MRSILVCCFIGILLLSTGCQQSNKQQSPKTNLDDTYVGLLTEQDLRSSDSTRVWFEPAYEAYTPNQSALQTIAEHISDYKIVVFMGTWCPDSHRELPKFYKILDETGFDQDQLTVYALDEYKSSKANYEKGYDIAHVPTIIFFKDGQEVNRFVEYAQESIAKDMAKIVSGQDYKHVYAP